MNYPEVISQVLMIVGILTIFVNIITEVMKKSFDWLSTSKVINLFVLGLSIVLTVGAFIAYWQIKGMTLAWYLIAAFVVIGIMVAYAAMFGFDKLMAYFEKK